MTRAAPTFDVTPFLDQDEGQHFDRKSLFDGEPGKKKPRERRTVRDQVVEYVSAFANAEGGVLILGIEDDRTLTGHKLPAGAVEALLDAPVKRLRPAQARGFVVEHGGLSLLVFDVPASDVPVQVEGDGFFLRMGDRTVAATEKQIQSLKFHGLAESWESRPSTTKLAELDRGLLATAKRGAGLSGLSDEAYLLKRKLADVRGSNLVLRKAAELLFASHGPEHPNAGIRLFRVVGSERKLGAQHNVEERPRIEGNLPHVLREMFAAGSAIVRRPSRLVGTRFREVPEYPEFSWKEAILNAVAHRDYSAEGRTTEVWFYDDRLEVVSPGGLLPDVRVEALRALERVHASRNPRTVRALVDLGQMRDQGEGIPRMFAEMEGLFLPAPTLDVTEREVRVTLRNTPTLTAEDQRFIASLGDFELSDLELRALLEASRHGRIDNARMRAISGLDTLSASQILRKLRDRGVLELHAAGAASYYTLESASGPGVRARSHSPGPQGGDLSHHLASAAGDLGSQLGAQAGDQASLPALPADLRAEIDELGSRATRGRLESLIARACQVSPMEPSELARLLRRDRKVLVRDYLTPMVRRGVLRLERPDQPNDPRQRYVATQIALQGEGETR